MHEGGTVGLRGWLFTISSIPSTICWHRYNSYMLDTYPLSRFCYVVNHRSMSTRCSLCANLSIQCLIDIFKAGLASEKRGYYQHHASLQDLRSSADNGCDLCLLMLSTCERRDREFREWCDQALPGETRSGPPKLPPSDIQIRIFSGGQERPLQVKSWSDVQPLDMITVESEGHILMQFKIVVPAGT